MTRTDRRGRIQPCPCGASSVVGGLACAECARGRRKAGGRLVLAVRRALERMPAPQIAQALGLTVREVWLRVVLREPVTEAEAARCRELVEAERERWAPMPLDVYAEARR